MNDISPVFLIDDDKDLLKATKQTLELAGFAVSAFAAAGDALAALDPGFAGVVVSDIRMPQMDGQELFARIDMLVLLAAPDFAVVAAWRSQQEHALRESLLARGMDSRQTLDDDQIQRFIQHYQRLTEHIIGSMPSYADLVVRLDARRRPLS